MKKIWQSALVAVLLGGSLIYADTNIYVGVDYAKASNTNTHEMGSSSIDKSNDFSDLSFKVGAGENGGLKAQLRFDIINYDEGVFDRNNNALVEIGLDVIKEFQVNQSFFPFIKLGIGVGSMDVEGYSESAISEISFNAGVGISYKALEHLYVMGGVDYVGRSWQDISYLNSTISTTSSGTKLYLGVNYAF